MGRFYLSFALLVLFSASPASGQYAAVVQACRGDAKQFCAAVQSGGGQLAECIKANFQSLSEPCKATLARTAGVGESCRADVRQQCPGIKPGISYGKTDDFSYNIVENPMEVHDLHATMLHLLGFNHERLTYRHQGRDFRLTDVSGKLVKDLIA